MLPGRGPLQLAEGAAPLAQAVGRAMAQGWPQHGALGTPRVPGAPGRWLHPPPRFGLGRPGSFDPSAELARPAGSSRWHRGCWGRRAKGSAGLRVGSTRGLPSPAQRVALS